MDSSIGTSNSFDGAAIGNTVPGMGEVNGTVTSGFVSVYWPPNAIPNAYPNGGYWVYPNWYPAPAVCPGCGRCNHCGHK